MAEHLDFPMLVFGLFPVPFHIQALWHLESYEALHPHQFILG
jgi:hypothetical protein